jgi:hypothetical protein
MLWCIYHISVAPTWQPAGPDTPIRPIHPPHSSYFVVTHLLHLLQVTARAIPTSGCRGWLCQG